MQFDVGDIFLATRWYSVKVSPHEWHEWDSDGFEPFTAAEVEIQYAELLEARESSCILM